MVIVKSCLYIVKNGEVLEETDVLESTGNSGLVDVGRGLSGKVLTV